MAIFHASTISSVKFARVNKSNLDKNVYASVTRRDVLYMYVSSSLTKGSVRLKKSKNKRKDGN